MSTLTVGGLCTATAAVVRRHFGVFATLAAAFVFLPSAALRLLAPDFGRMPAFAPGTLPAALPPGFMPILLVTIVIQFVAMFAIAAITADPAEGGGRKISATMTAALPALGRFLLAMLLFVVVYFIGAIVIGIVVALIGTIFALATPSAGAVDPAQTAAKAFQFAGALIAVIVPIMIWLTARLSPLVGVYLREPVGVIAGVRRAWGLSRGSALAIIGFLLLFIAATFAIVVVQYELLQAIGDSGLPATLISLVVTAVGALYFVYSAAGTGIIYRQLAAC